MRKRTHSIALAQGWEKEQGGRERGKRKSSKPSAHHRDTKEDDLWKRKNLQLMEQVRKHRAETKKEMNWEEDKEEVGRGWRLALEEKKAEQAKRVPGTIRKWETQLRARRTVKVDSGTDQRIQEWIQSWQEELVEVDVSEGEESKKEVKVGFQFKGFSSREGAELCRRDLVFLISQIQEMTEKEVEEMMPENWIWEDRDLQTGPLSVYRGMTHWRQQDVKWGLGCWMVGVDFKAYLQQLEVEEKIRQKGWTPGIRCDYVRMTANYTGNSAGQWNGGLEIRTKVEGECDKKAYGWGSIPLTSRHYNLRLWGLTDWDEMEQQLIENLGGAIYNKGSGPLIDSTWQKEKNHKIGGNKYL